MVFAKSFTLSLSASAASISFLQDKKIEEWEKPLETKNNSVRVQYCKKKQFLKCSFMSFKNT